LNFELFFARRLIFQSKQIASGLVVRLSIISIALAVATMEISLSVVQGFETEIQKKVIGFGSHVQIGNYYREVDTEVIPLPKDDPSLEKVRQLPNVASVSPYINRFALFKSETGWEGVLLKGVDDTYNWDFFSSVLKEGEIPNYQGEETSNQLLISRKQARSLDLQVGDKARLYFLPPPVRRRPVVVAGIYETGMEEFDTNIMICDLRLLQNIWRWNENQVSGFEVNLKDIESETEARWDVSQWPPLQLVEVDPMETARNEVNELTPYLFGALTISDLFPEIFDWLELQHQNVWFILILMAIVAVINMTSVVMILIIERTRTVGILKAMGLPNRRVQRMFIWKSFFLIVIGVALGNLLGLGLLGLQDAFGWIRVNQEDYFIETVPVAWVWMRFFFVNLGVTVIWTLFMVIPTVIINSISPVKAIRFE
jgi:lipoprotein-releasing system permease protein